MIIDLMKMFLMLVVLVNQLNFRWDRIVKSLSWLTKANGYTQTHTNKHFALTPADKMHFLKL